MSHSLKTFLTKIVKSKIIPWFWFMYQGKYIKPILLAYLFIYIKNTKTQWNSMRKPYHLIKKLFVWHCALKSIILT